MSKRAIAIICAFLVALFYAFNFTAAKEVTPEHIGPYGLTLYRVLITGIIFWGLSFVFAPRTKMTLKELAHIALAAFCGVGFNMLTFMKGLSLTSPISAAVLMVTTPILVLVLSAIFLKEKLFGIRILGILIGFSGATFLILQSTGIGADASNPTLGNFLIFVNALSYAFYIILAKKLTQKYHVLILLRWLYFFGVLFILPFGYNEIVAFDLSSASWETLMFIGYVIVFATLGTYGLNIIAIKNLKPSVVAVFVYLQPLLATIIAVSLDKDTITWQKIAAGIMIFSGVFLSSLKQKQKIRTT
ncbi:DMT family transporter [Nonlabens tegetincola]|nr:DMT family transporter [Nonlabens tegetincola]ARN72384.1 EamA family transporter [Nonlabens tegetincola]